MSIYLTRQGSGPALIFFHGWGFDHQIWMSLLPELIEKFEVFLVDLPGFGLTPSMDWLQFKNTLLNQIPVSFSLVGWSLGGLYAQKLLIEEPCRVSSLMCIGASPRFLADTHWPAVQFDVFNQFYKRLSLDVEGTLKEFIKLQSNNTTMPINLGVLPSKKGLEEGLGCLETWDLRQDLVTLNKKVCYVFGRLDPIAPVKLMQVMQATYPQFKYLLFKKAAHMPFLSHQNEFVEELTRFIS